MENCQKCEAPKAHCSHGEEEGLYKINKFVEIPEIYRQAAEERGYEGRGLKIEQEISFTTKEVKELASQLEDHEKDL